MFKTLLLKSIITNSITFNITNINDTPNTPNYNLSMPFSFNYLNILSLAEIAGTTYINNNSDNKIDIGLSNDTVHAYLFSDTESSTNVIAFKGTSLGLTGEVTRNDKFNDNLFFSCCYYEQSSLFSKDDCECIKSPNLCNSHYKFKSTNVCYNKCYKNSLMYPNNYYIISKQIIEKIRDIIDFDNTTIIFTGHSLGGALSTLMGITYNKTSVSFQSPGEKHYVNQLDLYYDQSILSNIYHIGHNADTIYTGKCNGILSWCYLAGYIIETKCHVGHVCDYDAINVLGIKESITTHPVKYVIENIIKEWKNGSETPQLPDCKMNIDCTECDNWIYV